MVSGPAHGDRVDSAQPEDKRGPALTDEQRAAAKEKFRGYVDETLEQLSKVVSIGEWNPDEKQDRAIAGFEGLLRAALTVRVSDETLQEIRPAIREGKAVFQSADQELCDTLADRFGIAITNILAYHSGKPLHEIPGIEEVALFDSSGQPIERPESAEAIEGASQNGDLSPGVVMRGREITPEETEKYRDEFFASLWLAQIALTRAVSYPPLVGQFADRVSEIPETLRASFGSSSSDTEEFSRQTRVLLVQLAAHGYQRSEQFTDVRPRMELRSHLGKIMSQLTLAAIYKEVNQNTANDPHDAAG